MKDLKDLKDLTLWTLWESPYGRKRVSLSKWLDLFVVTKSFQNDQNRWEMSELSEMKWNDGFDGFDLEQPYEKVPMVSRRWTLSKWLDVSENECPYQNEWNRWEMNELKWVEWIEVSRMNGWKWTRTTLWEWSYEWIERYPIKVTWCEWKSMSLSKWSESMRNELEWDRISEMRWNEWFDGKARRKSLWVEWRWTDGTDGTDGR